jgi:hypothetical protein
LNFIFGIVCLFVCVCAFSLRRESPNMILGDKPLIFEVVLSQCRQPQGWRLRRGSSQRGCTSHGGDPPINDVCLRGVGHSTAPAHGVAHPGVAASHGSSPRKKMTVEGGVGGLQPRRHLSVALLVSVGDGEERCGWWSHYGTLAHTGRDDVGGGIIVEP